MRGLLFTPPASSPFGTAIRSTKVGFKYKNKSKVETLKPFLFLPENIEDIEDMPTSFKVYWWFHNMTLVISICITIIYWAILYDETHPLNAVNVMTHATNSVLMFIDMMIVSHPYRLLHVIQPIILGVSYAIFSVIYYFAGGLDV